MAFDWNNLVDQGATVLTASIDANTPQPPTSTPAPPAGSGIAPTGQSQAGGAPASSIHTQIPWMYVGLGVVALIVGVVLIKKL